MRAQRLFHHFVIVLSRARRGDLQGPQDGVVDVDGGLALHVFNLTERRKKVFPVRSPGRPCPCVSEDREETKYLNGTTKVVPFPEAQQKPTTHPSATPTGI